MSFSCRVKNEIIEARLKSECCKKAMCYGMLLFSGSYNSRKIRLTSTLESVVRIYASLLRRCCGELCTETHTERTFCATVNNTEAVFSVFGAADTINEQIINCERCNAAFLKGAFLACGRISNPSAEYHLEFVSKNETALYFLCRLLRENDYDAKLSERADRYVVYLKNSENIEDILTLMGAVNCSLDIMNEKILRDIRNKTNRTTNFQTANIKKSSVSCAKQLEAIKLLQRQNRLITLPDELYELAIVRRENIDLSLTELGRLVGLSRAGVHHRLKKIIELSTQDTANPR